MIINIENPKTYKSLIESLNKIHEGCLIRDVRIEGISRTHIDVSYLMIDKADNCSRMTLRAVIDQPDEFTYWDGDETDRIMY
jgi:hypothetical protein